VISQDTSAYGVDLKYPAGVWRDRKVRTKFLDLSRELGEMGMWVRLHYVYPYPHVDEVIPLMAEGRLLPYLDVPFQHASPRILKLMKRPASAEANLERVRHWREVCPHITIRSTFIVGFPGETEEDFSALLNFLGEAQLDRVGCFAYSPVDGAAANALPDPVAEDLKEERRARFMAEQERISLIKLKSRVGRRLTVLVDEPGRGRSSADAPEIDGRVHFRGGKAGEFRDVLIERADAHDLFGRLQ
jgi:ribosomal protein S12 methylthiotransferase